MSRFFQDIVDNDLFIDWARTLDWLVNDDKFAPKELWSSGYVGSLTKKIKRLPYVSEKNYQHNAIKNLTFPKARSKTIKIIISQGDSEAKDLIRHIRNGIAHGKTLCFKNKNELYIEIKDYDKNGEKQTAYICFPLSYILKIHKLYEDVKKSHERNKKARKT